MKTSPNRATTACVLCGRPISPGRLQALPGVTMCIECARRNPPKKLLDRDVDLSQSSPINRNGFAPSD